MGSAAVYAHNEPTARLTREIFHPALCVSASISRYVRSFALNIPSIYMRRCAPFSNCHARMTTTEALTEISRMYPFELARPRFGKSGEPSGTSERTAPSDSAEPAPFILLSSSTHAYGSRLSTIRSFVCGPAARRRWARMLLRAALRG